MAYVKNIWVDQDVERPKTYEVTNNQDGSITLTDSFGLVTELGTPVNETNMNHIEEGIDGCAIRKHNLTETFNLDEWVLGGSGDDEGIYKSLIANNVGNAITDDTAWEKVKLGGSSRNVGEIVSSTLPLTDAGLHLLDGTRLSGDGIYGEFVQYIADLYSENPTANYFTDETSWQASVTQYGVCGKFVYDSVNNTVRLPKITGIIEGTTDLSALGDLVEAGLPNITGTFSDAGLEPAASLGTSGVLYRERNYSGNYYYHAGQQGAGQVYLDFDASRSSSIYGNSNTVQPQTVKVFYYIVIATSTKTDIQVDIDEIATDLNGKADIDLNNVPASKGILTESYVNGTSGYNIYSNKYCEQWGLYSSTGTHATQYSINLLKQYANTNYNIVGAHTSVNTVTQCVYFNTGYAKNVDSFTIQYGAINGSSYPFNYYWKTSGYIS